MNIPGQPNQQHTQWHLQLLLKQLMNQTDDLIRSANNIETKNMPHIISLMSQIRAALIIEANQLKETNQ